MVSDRVLRTVLRSDRAVALGGDLIRTGLAGVVVVAIALVIAYQSVLARFMFTKLNMNDFGKFYYSARLFLDGGDMYGPSPATAIPVGDHETRQFWNMNPPHFHLLMLPFATLQPKQALAAWGIVSFIALGLSLAIITRELQLRCTVPRMLWAGLLMSANAATGAVVITGQLTFPLLLAATVAWRAARHGRWIQAALWLGLLASVKPFLGAFWLYFVARRWWRESLVMAAAGGVAFAAGLAVFGWSAHVGWLKAVRSANWAWPPMNGSTAGIISRTFSSNPMFKSLLDIPEAVPAITSLVIVGIGIATTRALLAARANVDRTFLIMLLGILLVTPFGWIYYLWLPLGPALACWQPRTEWNFGSRLAAVGASLGLACPLGFTMIWSRHGWASPTIGSAYFWAVLGTWVLAIVPNGPFGAMRSMRVDTQADVEDAKTTMPTGPVRTMP